jgi:hypothetical protein
MKVEGPLYIVNGNSSGETQPQVTAKKGNGNGNGGTVSKDTHDVIKLVHSENRRAILPDPESLDQANNLVSELIDKLKAKNKDDLTEVHRVDPALLLRLF